MRPFLTWDKTHGGNNMVSTPQPIQPNTHSVTQVSVIWAMHENPHFDEQCHDHNNA
jgi:hypothetical protein